MASDGVASRREDRDIGRLRFALEVEAPSHESVRAQVRRSHGGIGHEELADSGRCRQSRGHVDGVAERGELDVLIGPDRADVRDAGVDADPDRDPGLTLPVPGRASSSRPASIASRAWSPSVMTGMKVPMTSSPTNLSTKASRATSTSNAVA